MRVSVLSNIPWPLEADMDHVMNLKWQAVFMSALAPCVVGHHKVTVP